MKEERVTVTYETILGAHDVEVPAHLVAQAEVPVLSGAQRQGDVGVFPTRPSKKAGVKIPAEGLPVVRGEVGGNTHLLVGDGTWAAHTARAGEVLLGVLTVPTGGTAFLLHPEHGANGIGAGCYTVRRKREQADEIRRVAD